MRDATDDENQLPTEGRNLALTEPRRFVACPGWPSFSSQRPGWRSSCEGSPGAFLGDDFSHLDLISRVDGQSQLWTWVLARFHEPLGNGTFAFRPIAFATFALDWLAYGGNATGWRANESCPLLP